MPPDTSTILEAYRKITPACVRLYKVLFSSGFDESVTTTEDLQMTDGIQESVTVSESLVGTQTLTGPYAYGNGLGWYGDGGVVGSNPTNISEYKFTETKVYREVYLLTATGDNLTTDTGAILIYYIEKP